MITIEPSNYKILLVDDEPDILEFLSYNLNKEGYNVYTAKDGLEAIKKAKKIIPDIIVLDVMMPNMDGMETCVELNKIEELKNTIKIFLTARAEEYSQNAGFEAGADDYITKPIKPKIFVNKINALLRRANINKEQTIVVKKSPKEIIKLNNLIIDSEKHLVIRNGKEFSLPKKEFKLLRLLSSIPGKVFTREEILNTIWGKEVVVGDRTIDVHIRKLREKLDLDGIVTIKGIGYKFIDNK